jgi:fumarylpyruvate hydrolase
MSYLVAPGPQPRVSVSGGGEFPVHRIYCVGRNYAAHAREMGHDPDREEPFFFLKPADAVVPSNQVIAYPPMTQDFHHEVELVLAIGREGAQIPADEANAYIYAAAVGIDLTRRDLQTHAKKLGRPWDMGKSFDASAPCGVLLPTKGQPISGDRAIWLKVNGQIRQSSQLSELIWSPAEVIFWLSKYVTLKPGDLIYTGTPEGVGPLVRGDRVHGHIDGLDDLLISIA